MTPLIDEVTQVIEKHTFKLNSSEKEEVAFCIHSMLEEMSGSVDQKELFRYLFLDS